MPEFKGKDVPAVNEPFSKKKKSGKKKKVNSRNVPEFINEEVDIQELLKK